MRKIGRQVAALGVLAGVTLLATAPSAFAQGTQSPEGIGIEATGLIPVPATPNATSSDPDPASVASVGVAGILTADAVYAKVNGNTTTAGVAGISALSILSLGISANAISSTCTANANGTFTESASIADLEVLGLHVPLNPAPNTTLSIPGLITVILNQQVAGPTSGSKTVTAVVLELPLGEDIDIASSTCG